jgi:YVTN family beta-propeller protein
VPNEADGTVSRIDPATNRVVATIRIGTPREVLSGGCSQIAQHAEQDSLQTRLCDFPSSVIGDRGTVWAADNGAGGLARIDPSANRVVQRIGLNADPFAIGSGYGSLWVTAYFHSPHEVLRVDPVSGRIQAAIIDLPPSCGTGIAVGEGGVWVACTYAQSLARIDPSTDRVTAVIPVQQYPLALKVGLGAVWVRNEDSNSVSRVDPRKNLVTATVTGLSPPMGRNGDDAMAIGESSLWTAGIQLLRIDPEHDKVVARIELPGDGISEGFGSLWQTSVQGTVQRIDPGAAAPVVGGD